MKKLPSDPCRDHASFVERMRSLKDHGWTVSVAGEVCGMPILTAERSSGNANPQVLLVGGIHGDEPAGVEAAVSWMESGQADCWPVDWLVLPCANPCGWSHDRRNASANHDLNRSFNLAECCDEIQIIRATLAGRRFLFSMDFHEDCDAPGYYLCEIKARSPFAGEQMIEAVEAVLPIWDVPRLDGRKAASRGCVRRSSISHTSLHRRRLWPLEFHLLRHHTEHTFCSETPMTFPLERRVQAHHAALEAALNVLIEHNFNKPTKP
ncbi:MAG: succinylglutamate desuccinylase/aspartoacylase family protein [Prosthecobacter sp.]